MAKKSNNRHSIQALKSVIRRNEGILIQEYLDLHSFEDISISQLGLSVRATNCLMRKFGKAGTLRSVLEMRLKSLISFKNAGAKTVQEILFRVEELTDTNLDSRQIYFVNQIVECIAHNCMMRDLSVLQEPPFTDHGSIVEVFTDMSVWMGIKIAIDQANANTVAV